LRVAEEIQHVLGRMLIEDNLSIAGLKPSYTMITGVKIAPDMSHASVLVRAIPPVDTDEQVALLNENKGKFRYRLGKAIRLRIVPDIVFKSDVRFEETKEMDDLLNNPKVRADVEKYQETN
jgi:ribosome-binding factor A